VLEDIVAEDRRASEVIRRLRALFMRGTIQMQVIDANDCIREVLKLQHSDLIRRNVLVELELAPEPPAVVADRVQLQQVLLNLIVNACDAMVANSPDGRHLRISTMKRTDNGLDIEICDRGHGIQELDKIFEPFYSTKDHGLGLGLSICRTIIATHQGRLWATNNADCGATLHVSFPPVAAHTGAPASAGRASTTDPSRKESSAADPQRSRGLQPQQSRH
jgi:signal transduction histidine kinase